MQTFPKIHSSRAGSTWWFKAGLAIGGACLAVLLAECGLRMAPLPAVRLYMQPTVTEFCTRPHPTLQYANRENFCGEFSGLEFRTIVRINAKGLRDRDYPYAKPAGRRRCLLLGDSFVFGWGVETHETVAKQMETRLRDVEVINGGCSGWGTRQEETFLEEEGIRYEPDVVLLFFFENDPWENSLRYKFVNGRLRGAEEPEGWAGEMRCFLRHHSAVGGLLRYGRDKLRQEARGAASGGGKGAGLWRAEEACLQQLQDFCAQRRTALAVLYVPVLDQARHPAHGGWFAPLSSFCGSRSMTFLDLTPALAQANRTQPVYFRYDMHWNRAGHQTAAEAVLSFLAEKGWLSQP